MKNRVWMLVTGVVLSVSMLAYAGYNAQKRNIVETAVNTEGFSTLVKLVQEAGLVDALKGEGPFTVFAPNDEAFARLTDAEVQALLKDKEALRQVLLYHVVPGKVMAKDVVNLRSAKTLQGKEVNIRVRNNVVYINNAKVIATDVETSNGVIHVIDTVILPPK